MKRNWLFVLCAAVLVVATVLIWNSTAERRYVAKVRKLEWSAAWSEQNEFVLSVDLLGESGGHRYVADPQLQKCIFDALRMLTFEGKTQPHHQYHASDEAYQIMLRQTEVGSLSFVLLAAEPGAYDRRPRAILYYDNDTDIILGGTEALLEAAKATLTTSNPHAK